MEKVVDMEEMEKMEEELYTLSIIKDGIHTVVGKDLTIPALENMMNYYEGQCDRVYYTRS